MAIVVDWTKSLDVARLHADPSGVQETSTTFQALLFPGMSPQTARLRYISLLAAARHYRMQLGSEVNVQLPLSEYLRRFEALIAVSSTRSPYMVLSLMWFVRTSKTFILVCIHRLVGYGWLHHCR
jgi:hypothetical protein